MSRRRGPVRVEDLVAEVLARTGQRAVNAPVLLDVAQVLADMDRLDLAAEWALKAYRQALADGHAEVASRALTLLVARLGSAGRQALRAL